MLLVPTHVTSRTPIKKRTKLFAITSIFQLCTVATSKVLDLVTALLLKTKLSDLLINNRTIFLSNLKVLHAMKFTPTVFQPLFLWKYKERTYNHLKGLKTLSLRN